MSSNRFLSGSLTKGSKAHDIDIEGVTSGTVINGGDVHANGHYVKTHDQYSQRMLFFPRSNSSDILYHGGSVNTENCSKIFELNNVHGALIGGASLKFKDFLAIYKSAVKQIV